MKKYKVGDRVRIKTGLEYGTHADGIFLNSKMRKWEGKVMTIESDCGRMGYHMLEDIGELASDTGWFWVDAWIEGLANDNKIVITTEGDTVLARLYDGKKVIGMAEAKCSKDDKFVFATGAQLAFDRLLGNEPKKEEWFTGKMVRVSTPVGVLLPKGKVYYFKDGYETTRDGVRLPCVARFRSEKEIARAFAGDLVSLIE